MEQADPHLATVEGVRERIQDIRTNFEAAHKTTGNIVNYLMLQLEQQVQHCLSLQSTVQSLQQEKAQMDSYIQILSGQLQDHQKRAQEDQEWKEKGVQALAFLKQKALSSTQGWNTCSLELKWAKRNLSEKEMELDACRTKLDETEQKLARISLEFEAARAKAIGEDGVGGHVKGLSDEQRKQIEEALKSELDTRSQVILQKAQLAISAAVKRTEQTHRARIQELELELERYKAASNAPPPISPILLKDEDEDIISYSFSEVIPGEPSVVEPHKAPTTSLEFTPSSISPSPVDQKSQSAFFQ